MVLCPNCGKSRLGYCRECGQSYPFPTSSICRNELPHTENPNRELYCASCGLLVDKEGVIRENGQLILFAFIKARLSEGGR